MNTSKLFKLFSFLLLSGAFASQQTNNNSLRNQLSSIIGTGNETLEQVEAIFAGADVNDMCDFACLRILKQATNPEVLKYVLSKSVMILPIRRANAIVEILQNNLLKAAPRIRPDETALAMVSICLEELKKYDFEDISPQFANKLSINIGHLLVQGQLSLVQEVLDAGFKMTSRFYYQINDLQGNRFETVKFLVGRGFDISEEGHTVRKIMGAHDLTVEFFQFLLDNGLPLDYEFAGSNWLAIALENGRFDIAELVFAQGLRLSKAKLATGHLYLSMQENIDKFIHNAVMRKASNKAVLLLFGNGDDESILSALPRELVAEIISEAFDSEKRAFIEDLFRLD